MTFLFEAATNICGTLALEKSLHRGFQFLQKRMPLDGIYTDIFLRSEQKLQFLAHATRKDAERLALAVDVPRHLAQTLDDPNRPSIFRVAEIEEDPITAYSAPRLVAKIRSFMIMRMALDAQHLGVIILYSHKNNAFNESHQKLLQSLHDPFALATAKTLLPMLEGAGYQADIGRPFLQPQLLSIGMTSVDIVGARAGLHHVMTAAMQVAPYDATVLLKGETGSGKEVIANAIHRHSGRADGPFVKVNCGAVPETLLDSEFFGHEKGAFTDARQIHQGYFEQANHGTLFLDEISELSPGAQVRLLRVLQDKVVMRVGGVQPLALDVRIIAATNRDLQKMVQQKEFREDLWYRLNIFPITLPPLRERRDDIPALIRYFLERLQQKYEIRQALRVSEESLALAMAAPWPGNVRELENMLERAVLQTVSRFYGGVSAGVVDLRELQERQGQVVPRYEGSAGAGHYTLEDATREYLRNALCKCNGKIYGEDGAAAMTGLHPSTLRSKLKKIGLDFES